MGQPGSSAYRAAGVDYQTLDAGKRSALTEALATSELLHAFGGRALDESRGEPAFVFETAGRLLAFVVEGLGTKSIIARHVEEQLGVSLFGNVAYDTVAAIVNDLCCVGALPCDVDRFALPRQRQSWRFRHEDGKLRGRVLRDQRLHGVLEVRTQSCLMRNDEILRHVSASTSAIPSVVDSSLFYSLRDLPQQVGRKGRSQEGDAVAQDRDELGQMLQLQPIVERVPEAMRPMEEWRRDQNEKVESYQRMRQEAVEELVTRRLEPSLGKGEASQKEMDGE